MKRLLFFPGALVDPVAYAPLARAMADRGYRTTILELPRRGAFGDADDPGMLERVRAIMNRDGGSTPWIIAGHSKGAVVASYIASQNVGNLAGLVLIGSTHPRDVSLASLSIPVTKIAATRDGLASPEKVRANAAKLPASTRWVWIEGGNHSQFGWYGFQPGDRFARIPAREQRALMIQAVLDALQGKTVR
jgi:pimeloyl-ACP methyl ester carboxylesterase